MFKMQTDNLPIISQLKRATIYNKKYIKLYFAWDVGLRLLKLQTRLRHIFWNNWLSVYQLFQKICRKWVWSFKTLNPTSRAK